MRALVRAKIHPFDHFDRLWDIDRLSGASESTDDYEQTVKRLFRSLHYSVVDVQIEDITQIISEIDEETARSNSKKASRAKTKTYQLKLSPEHVQSIKEIIREIPESIRKTECRRVVCFGYSSDGQSHFLVFAMNINDLHIRIRGGLFGKTEQACKDLIQKAAQHRKGINSPARNIKAMLTGSYKNANNVFMTINPSVDVMEPGQSMPTIKGEIVESVWKEIYKSNRREVLLSIIFFSVAFLLLVFSPTMAIAFNPTALFFENVLKSFLNPNIVPNYTVDYIQGALERTYSALFVSSVVSIAGLATKVFDIVKTMPIKWVMEINES